MAINARPLRLGLALAATTGMVAASSALMSPASAAPAALSFTITSMDAGSGITLGEPNGERQCSGEEGTESFTCTQPMGILTSHGGTIGIVDASGETGTIDVTCTVMYAGVYTMYWSQPSSADATGSEDCELYLNFSGGSEVWGAMHQQRILVANAETSTFAFTFTRGTGKYDGINATFSMTDTQAWTPGPPLKDDWRPNDPGPDPQPEPEPSPGPEPSPTSSVASFVTSLSAALARAEEMPMMTAKQSAKPIVDVTSMGLLAPKNKAARVAVTAAAGSVCSGSLTAGKTRIALAKKTVSVKSGAVVLRQLKVGELKSSPQWTLTITCSLKGKQAKVTKKIKTFEALPFAQPV
jgi:hypothetical protein